MNETKNKPFSVRSRSIHAALKQGPAMLTRKVQTGTLPSGRSYRLTDWWVKFDDSPCAMGPWTKAGVRRCFGGAQ